jgi:probable phosphoglycerate mutase
MAIVFLVRHGQNDWVKKHRLAGWIAGIHLNKKGREEAEDAAGRLGHLPIKAVYSSPLERCRETADIIAGPHKLEVADVPEVGEVGYGDWQGEKIKRLAKLPEWQAVQYFPSRFRFPGGETLAEVQRRAVAALEELSERHEKEMIVVVSHADVIKLVLAYYLGMHIDLFQRLVISPASINVLSLSKAGRPFVLRLNDTGPMDFPDPAKEAEKQKRRAEEKAKRAQAGQSAKEGKKSKRGKQVAGEGEAHELDARINGQPEINRANTEPSKKEGP